MFLYFLFYHNKKYKEILKTIYVAPKKYNRGDSSNDEAEYYLISPKHENGKYFLGIREAKTRSHIDKRVFLDPEKGRVYVETYNSRRFLNTDKHRIKQFIEMNCLDIVVERLSQINPKNLAKPTKRAIPIRIID